MDLQDDDKLNLCPKHFLGGCALCPCLLSATSVLLSKESFHKAATNNSHLVVVSVTGTVMWTRTFQLDDMLLLSLSVKLYERACRSVMYAYFTSFVLFLVSSNEHMLQSKYKNQKMILSPVLYDRAFDDRTVELRC